MKKSILITTALASLLAASNPVLAQTCNSSIPLDRPDSRYTDNGDGTVTDNVTGLMWKHCSEGQSTTTTACDTGSAATYTWQGALAQAQTVNAAGFATYSDWRLPNIKELKSLAEMACYTPAINIKSFPATPAAGFWSASPDASGSGNAWFVYFGYGGDGWGDKGGTNYVRLVRAGQ
jgi:hypothetical protein